MAVRSIAVYGSWHLALVMATCFAEKGYRVTVTNPDDRHGMAALERGRTPLYEPKMDRLLRLGLAAGRLHFTTDVGMALRGAAVAFLAVDTPLTPEGVSLEPIWEGAKRLAVEARSRLVLVVSSQVPVGSCEALAELARSANPAARIDVACNPEFLRLGSAIDRFRRPDCIVIGASDPKVAAVIQSLYRPFRRPVLTMSLREAEMVKHATNAYMATSVSFISEISQLSDELGVDAFQISRALRLDRRIGKHAYVRPGLGFNGGTVARDVKVLIETAKRLVKETPLLEAVLRANQRQNLAVVHRLQARLGSLAGKRIGLLGLTYKAKTSTLRESLALHIARLIAQEGVSVVAYDPRVRPGTPLPADGVILCGSPEEVAIGSDALVIMTDKPEFARIDYARLAGRMRQRVLVDAVNLLDPAPLLTAGFTYVALGRGFRWLGLPQGEDERRADT